MLTERTGNFGVCARSLFNGCRMARTEPATSGVAAKSSTGVKRIDFRQSGGKQRGQILLQGLPHDGFDDIVVTVPIEVPGVLISRHGKPGCLSRNSSGRRRLASDMISSARVTAKKCRRDSLKTS
jgi:hypothetical protein